MRHMSAQKHPLEPSTQSNVIAKLLNHKALLCDIQQSSPVLSSVRLPDNIHSSTVIVMTAGEEMFLLGGEHKGVFTGVCA